MSYCRFSSMNWRCDVYVYADYSGGWTTHVAGRRKVLPPVPDIMLGRLSMWIHRWSGCNWDRERREFVYPHRWRGVAYRIWNRFSSFWYNRVHMVSLHLIPLRPIGLPHDGETFNDPSSIKCAARLDMLRAVGYIVPQSAIDELLSEEQEEP